MRHIVRRSTIIGLACGALLAAPSPARAQASFNPRDDQFRALGLMRAEAEYTRAAREMERARLLRARGFLSAQELESSTAQLERARVDYLQQALAVLSQGAHVAVLRAIKHRGPADATFVSLAIGESGGSANLEHARAILGDSSFAALRAGDADDLYVSLKAEPGPGGAIIGWPYERRFGAVGDRTARSAEFRLLRDVDEVVVSVAHGDKVDERRILLEQDAAANLVAVEPTQFSQEADLGTQVTFLLQLTRFARDEKEYHLQVDGLPGELQYEFRDPDSRTRLTRLRFAPGASRKALQLIVTLPLQVTPAVLVDRPLPLDARVLEVVPERAAGAGLPGTTTKLAGRARLELVPRGIARGELRAINLYHEIVSGDSVVVDGTVRNSGSATLRNVRVQVETPASWTARVTPASWGELGVGREMAIAVTLVPPADPSAGDYEVRLRLESAASGDRSGGEDRIVRVHVAPSRAWLGTVLLTGLVLVAIGGVGVLGVRLTRR